jgi:DNA-binding NarL/FixJ family response regulator
LAGLLARDTTADALQLALGTVLHGLFVLDRAFAPEPSGIVDGGTLPRTLDADPLTAREQEVVQLMAEGLSNKQIADRLGISTHTAKFHVNAVLGKLGASTRTEAVVRALQRGVVML